MKRTSIAGVICAVLALCVLVSLANAQGARSFSRTNPFDKFPLWKDVPGRTFAVLGEGKLRNGTRWGAYVSRVGAGQTGFENPCVTVANITRGGEYGPAHACGLLLPNAAAPAGDLPVEAHFSTSYQLTVNGPVRGESFTGLLLAPSVQRVVLVTSTGQRIKRQMRRLSSRQRAKTKLPEMSYLALAQQRDICIEWVRGFDATGQMILNSNNEIC